MTTAVRLLAFDSIPPTLGGAVHDGRRLSVVHGTRLLLGAEHESDVESIGNLDDVPVIEVEEPMGSHCT